MKYQDFVEIVAEKTDLSRSSVKSVLEACVETIRKEVGQGGAVRIPGLGTFRAAERRARMGRNPRTGEAIQIPGKRVVKFRAARNFL